MSQTHISNSAILIDRAHIETVHEMLVAAANAMLLSASLLTDRLDENDGDSDFEPNGDERDGNLSEEDFCRHSGFTPGCPISDPGGDEHDGRAPDDGV